MDDIQEILKSDDKDRKLALFRFSSENTNEEVLFKFNIWGRHFFPKYFQDEDAEFHEDINRGNLDAFRGSLDSFIDIAFRGAGKDVKTKLFIPFCILNDKDRRKRFFKVLTEDLGNAKQIVTDIYNMLVEPRIVGIYPDTFEKTIFKREETMQSFTTSKGVKVLADTVGTEQRGAIQEDARPDFIWFNDFESRKTLRSATTTKSIWDNMEEARTGLQKGGCCIYTCNYLSEAGNVHKLVTEKLSDRKRILITPIAYNLEKNILDDGKTHIISCTPSWSRFSVKDIDNMFLTDDDFDGERMCKPDASKDLIFDREKLDSMQILKPIREISGFKIYKKYDPGHRYASGHDVSGGVGLDHSASVFIDFHTFPAHVVGTFYSNTVEPEAFGDEVFSETDHFGGCLAAIENNKFDSAVLKAKQLGAKLYKTKTGTTLNVGGRTEIKHNYGWNTNSLTKSQMFSALKKAVNDGLLELSDPDLIKEAKAFTRNDLIDRQPDPRDVANPTRHFDLLTAAAIAWQMKDHAEYGPDGLPTFVSVPLTEESANPAE